MNHTRMLYAGRCPARQLQQHARATHYTAVLWPTMATERRRATRAFTWLQMCLAALLLLSCAVHRHTKPALRGDSSTEQAAPRGHQS